MGVLAVLAGGVVSGAAKELPALRQEFLHRRARQPPRALDGGEELAAAVGHAAPLRSRELWDLWERYAMLASPVRTL